MDPTLKWIKKIEHLIAKLELETFCFLSLFFLKTHKKIIMQYYLNKSIWK